MASSNSQFEPQLGTTQSGASRSVSPATARRETRLWDCRNSGSVVESWYLSPNMEDGRVRYEYKEQESWGGCSNG